MARKKKAAAAEAPVEGKVVEASLSAGAGGGVGGPALTGRQIEDAMNAAVAKAYKNGVTDPDKILKLKLAARESVKADFRKAQAKAAKAQAAAQRA